MSLASGVNYSIIICTYNPDEELMVRCLNAVSRLNNEGLTLEVILVDNNSTDPLAGQAYIKNFLNTFDIRFMEVKKQGLRYARMAAIEAALGSYIVFFDDDNEPDANYIQVLSILNRDYPDVAAWGPGCVDVDFVNGIDEKLEKYATEAFQDRHEKSIVYSSKHSWQPFYPFGTGLCLRKDYLLEYITLAEQNKFTLTGRKGGQMTSGEDIQMVLFCISKGASAGVAPDLKLVHMVPTQRATFNYLKRLTYGTSVCYSTCVSEVFPEYIIEVENRVVDERKFIRRVMKKYIKLFFKPGPTKTFDLINYIGVVSGDYIVLNKTVPPTVTWVLKKLKAI